MSDNEPIDAAINEEMDAVSEKILQVEQQLVDVKKAIEEIKVRYLACFGTTLKQVFAEVQANGLDFYGTVDKSDYEIIAACKYVELYEAVAELKRSME